MSSWAEEKLSKVGSTQPAVSSWAQKKLKTVAAGPPVADIESPMGESSVQPGGSYSLSPESTPRIETETNPFYTAGKKIWSVTRNQMLPSMNVAASLGIEKGLMTQEFIADRLIDLVPGLRALDKELAKSIPIPKLSELQRKYFTQDAVAEAQYRKGEDAKFTESLINSWDEVAGPVDAMNWGVGAISQLAPQVVAAIYTVGGSAIGQEVGSIYTDSIERIAKEHGITTAQVFEQNLDEPAVAVIAGSIAGLLEYAGAKGVGGRFGNETIKKFLDSSVGKFFRSKMYKWFGKPVVAGTGEAVTEGLQTGIEHVGTVIDTQKSIADNISTALKELKKPSTITDIKESMRQGGFGGHAARTIGIAGGSENKIPVPATLRSFSRNVLQPDASKHGQRDIPKTNLIHLFPEKMANPVVEQTSEMMSTDEKGTPIAIRVNLLDTGLINGRTAQIEYIEERLHPSGIGASYFFDGQQLKADNAQQATTLALEISDADAKIVYPVTGDIKIEKAATNDDGTAEYVTGLQDSNTGMPVIVFENPKASGPQFSAYSGGVVGSSVEEVAQKVQEIGTPNITDAQAKRADDLLRNEGVSKESLTRVYKNVYGYSKQQAAHFADQLMGKINKGIKDFESATTPTDLEKQNGSTRKPVKKTAEEVFAEMAINDAKQRGEAAKAVTDLLKKAAAGTAVSPTPGAKPVGKAGGKLGILETPTAPPVEPLPAAGPRTIDVKKITNAKNRDYPSGKKGEKGVVYKTINDFLNDVGWGNTAYKEIFDYLSDKGVKMEFRFAGGRDLGNGTYSAGHYNANTNSIVVYNHTPLQTLGHEAIHAALYASGAWKSPEFNHRMTIIRDNIKAALKADPKLAHTHMTGLSQSEIDHFIDYTTNTGSLQEIVTHAFTLPGYANFLAQIPSSVDAKPGDTAWGRLKEIIIEYVGKALNLNGTALDELNAVLDEYAGINVKTKPTIKEKAAPAPAKKEKPVKPTKPKKDAVQEQSPDEVPVQPAPGRSKEVGKGVSEPRPQAPANEGKEKGKGNEEIADLPTLQRNAGKRLIGQKHAFVRVIKMGPKIHPILEMKKGDKSVFVNYKGDVFNTQADVLSKSFKEEAPAKKAKKKVPPAELVTGDTSKDQPAMQPAADRPKVAETPKLVETPPTKLPIPPAVKPADQPSENVSETADMVVELLGQAYDILPKNMPRKELLDFIAALDENGRPLGQAKAFAIASQMEQLGYIKASGSKVNLLFSTQLGHTILGDPNVDYPEKSREAAKAAEAASKTTVQGQADQDFVTSIKEFFTDLPEAIGNDSKAAAGELAKAADIPMGLATGLYDLAKTTPELFNGLTAGAVFRKFFSALSHGRSTQIKALGMGLGFQIARTKNITPTDFVNPISYIRAVAAIASAGISVVQAGTKIFTGNLDSEFFAPGARRFADWVADRTKAGVTSQNLIIRNVNQIMQGFYRGLTYTSAEVRKQSQLRGKRQEGAFLAQQWMDGLYSLIGRSQESLARIHAVLDPEVYAKSDYKDTTYLSLTDAEKAVYAALRLNMDNLHNWSLAKGYISPETYSKFLNEQGEINYFGRAYQEFYDAQALGEDVAHAANALRGDFTIYKHRKDFKDIKDLNIEQDPIFIAAHRMATALQNEAVTDYADGIHANPKIPKFKNTKAWEDAGKPKGFTQIGDPSKGKYGVYGKLTGVYVPNYVAYDFKGFFLSSHLLNSGYSFIKAYDRLWLRRKMKQLLTVYNPAVNLGNQTSNYTFAFVDGVDSFNFNMGIQIAQESIKNKDEMYRKVLAEGLLGTGISAEFQKRLPARLEELAKTQKSESKSVSGKLSERANKIESSYSNIDDEAKLSAYWVKTQVYGISHDQAITEILQGFQNYDSVGMYFDVGSKMPIVGNAFAKFSGDLARIVGTSVTHRPLATAAYLAFIKAISEMTSDESDEDDLEKEIRQGRPFQPKIPFVDLPLGWMFGKHEVNVARLIAPYQVYDKGGKETSGLMSVLEFLPVKAMVASSGGRPSYFKFDDPFLGPIISVLYDKDFRGISISDPKKILGSEWSTKEKNLNRLEYYFRSFGFLPMTATDVYHIHTSGEDYYGRNKSTWDRLVSIFIRVEEFSTPEAKAAVQREIDSRTLEIEGIMKDNNSVLFRVERETTKILGKDISLEQKRNQIEELQQQYQKTIIDSTPRIREALKELHDPMTYQKLFAEREAKSGKPSKQP